MATLRIFISHAAADVLLAEKLADHLKGAGADVWVDSTHLVGPGDFVAHISRALNERDILILILSPAAISSPWVQAEMNAAVVRANQGFMEPPLVVSFSTVPLRDIPGLWTIYQRIDATTDYDDALNRILAALGLQERRVGDASSASSAPLLSPVAIPIPTTTTTRPPPIAASSSDTNQTLLHTDYDNSSETELLIEFNPPGIPHHRVQLIVHKEYSLDLDDFLSHALLNCNAHRVSRGLIRYYPGVVYRVLRPPLLTDDDGDGIRLQIDLSILNFAYYGLLREESVSSTVKAYIANRIAEIAKRIPDKLSSQHPHINSYNATPLGMMMVLITQDEYTLLRRRGKSVLDGPASWDVSFGGYCEVENVEEGILKIVNVAEMELGDELSRALPRNPLKLRFTGVCRNNRSSAIDILGYWKIDATAQQLVDAINNKHPNEITRVFETTQKADEEFVHDTHNLIVKCHTEVIEQALHQAGIGGRSLVPEAQVALNLALRCREEPYLRLE